MRDDPMSVSKQLPSPVVSPLADKHAAQPTSLVSNWTRQALLPIVLSHATCTGRQTSPL